MVCHRDRDLGPILFITLYTADLAPTVADHDLSLHQYADDSQNYGSCPPAATSSLSTVDHMSRGLVDAESLSDQNDLHFKFRS